MCAQQGVALVLAVAVQSNEGWCDEVIAVEVYAKENNEGVYDEEWALEFVEHVEEKGEGIVLKHANINIVVVNHGRMRYGRHVESDVSCAVIE